MQQNDGKIKSINSNQPQQHMVEARGDSGRQPDTATGNKRYGYKKNQNQRVASAMPVMQYQHEL